MLTPIQLAIRAIIVLAVCGLLTSASVRADNNVPPSRTELGKANWSVTASPNLAKDPPSKAAVEDFVRAQVARTGDDSVTVDLCSFKFADLRHHGTLSLVAGVDYSGRGLCDNVLIVDRAESGFRDDAEGGANGVGSKVSAEIKDLGNDGNLELQLDRPLNGIIGRCGASFPVIYAWSGDSYADVSGRFRDFYRRELEKRKKALAALRPELGLNGETLGEKECDEAEIGVFQRYLGISSEAGLDQAIRLSNSKDPAERDFAVNLLYRIGTPKAWKYIAILANDSDYRVAFDAKRYLSFPTSGATPIPSRP